MPRRRLTWKKKLAFALVPLLLLLGLVELICREFPPPGSTHRRTIGYIEPDPDLLWRLKPLAGGPQQTNALGLRDTPYAADADVKVLLLGDSISYGDGEPDINKVYPQLLERLLHERDPARSYEVINSGVVGYATWQELGYLERDGLALAPQAVILQFCLNDVFEPYTTVAAYGGESEFFGIDTREGMRGLHGVLVRGSKAYERLALWWQRRARDREAYSAERLASDTLPPELSEGWEKTEADLDRLLSVCRARELPLLVLVTPYAFQLDGGRDQPQRRLAAWCQRSDVPLVDLLPAFARSPLPKKQLFFDANHFAPGGHRLAAETLIEPVRAFLAR